MNLLGEASGGDGGVNGRPSGAGASAMTLADFCNRKTNGTAAGTSGLRSSEGSESGCSGEAEDEPYSTLVGALIAILNLPSQVSA